MSQFMLIEREVSVDPGSGIELRPIGGGDAFLRQVATTYFAAWNACRVVTDASGGGESLVDDLWAAHAKGDSIEETALGCYMRRLVDSRVRFVLWAGGEHADLPMVRWWDGLVHEVEQQVSLQPAEVWLSFEPR